MSRRQPVPPDPTIVDRSGRLVAPWRIYLASLSEVSGAAPLPHQPALSGGATLADVIAAFNTLRANLIAANLMRPS